MGNLYYYITHTYMVYSISIMAKSEKTLIKWILFNKYTKIGKKDYEKGGDIIYLEQGH